MNKAIWINKARSFQEAERFDRSYYVQLSHDQRIEIMQELREEYFESTGLLTDENGKRLRRVLRVIKQA
jgi:hypothetical protein